MLPASSDAGIAESAAKKVNEAIRKELDGQKSKKSLPKKCKAYTAFSDETHTNIERYAAENSNTAALKKFHSDIADLGQSTVWIFKERYLEELKGATVNSIVSCRSG